MSGSGPQRPSYDELAALVTEQGAVIAALTAEVTGLRAEVAELRGRLRMDSSNSSKPPSSDGLDRTKRSTSGSGKRGKPRGAPGATKMLVDDPDERIACRPSVCGNCAGDLSGARVFARQRRQVFDVPPPPKPHVTEYQVESLLCPGCGAVTCGDAPDGVAGRLQYGPGAKARMVYLRGAQYLPFGRAAHAATHAECAAHLLRALNGVYESDPVGQEWAEAMANTLLIAKDMMAEAAAAGQRALDDAQVSFIRSAHAGALACGREATAKHPTSKAAKLVNRFARDADEILRFTTDTAIWFSNNQSERDLRPTKLQLKISATWRSLQGLADFAALRSYLSTASKHGEDLLDVLTALFTTGPWLPPDPAPDPS